MTVILLQFPWHTHTPLNIHYVKKNDCTHATKDTVGLYTPFNDKKRKSNTVIYLFILQPKPLLGFSLLIFVVAGFLRFEIFNGT
jgi:hypothetical protein